MRGSPSAKTRFALSPADDTEYAVFASSHHPHSQGGQMVVGQPRDPPLPTSLAQTLRPMKNDKILSQISEYCRQADMADSPLCRLALNHCKLVHPPPAGKTVTTHPL